MTQKEDYEINRNILIEKIRSTKSPLKEKYIDELMTLYLNAYEDKLIDSESFGYLITGIILDCNKDEILEEKYRYYHDEIFDFAAELELAKEIRSNSSKKYERIIIDILRKAIKNL